VDKTVAIYMGEYWRISISGTTSPKHSYAGTSLLIGTAFDVIAKLANKSR
jgi:hypothetical protein